MGLTCEAGRAWKAQDDAPVKRLACLRAADACKSLQGSTVLIRDTLR